MHTQVFSTQRAKQKALPRISDEHGMHNDYLSSLGYLLRLNLHKCNFKIILYLLENFSCTD